MGSLVNYNMMCVAMLSIVCISTSEAGYTYHGNDNMNYADAKNACAASGQILAMPKTEAQQTAVADLLAGEGDIWIGLDILDGGQFKWADGSNLGSWTFWKDNEPSGTDQDDIIENCVHMVGASYFRWNDRSCTANFAFLCEGNVSCLAI